MVTKVGSQILATKFGFVPDCIMIIKDIWSTFLRHCSAYFSDGDGVDSNPDYEVWNIKLNYSSIPKFQLWQPVKFRNG